RIAKAGTLNSIAAATVMAARASHISPPVSALPLQCAMPMSGSRLFQFEENVSRTNKLRSRCCAGWPGAGQGFLKKEEPHPRLRLCFDGKCDRGEPLMLNVSVRPQLAAVAAVSALAATVGETSSDENLVKQIAVGSKP